MDQKSQDEIAGLKLDLQVANHKLNMANQTIADLESRVVQEGMIQVSEYQWEQLQSKVHYANQEMKKKDAEVRETRNIALFRQEQAKTAEKKIEDYERRIRQLEDEQEMYSGTAMYARIHELEAVVEQYEKQVTAIRKAVNMEVK